MFSQTEILLMIFVVSILLIFIIVLTVLDILEYRKNKGIVQEVVEEENNSLSTSNITDEVTIMEVEDEKELEPVKAEVYENNDNDLFVEREEDTNHVKDAMEVKTEEKEIEPVLNEVEENVIEPFVSEKVEVNNVVAPEITYHDYQEMPTRVNLNEELSVKESQNTNIKNSMKKSSLREKNKFNDTNIKKNKNNISQSQTVEKNINIIDQLSNLTSIYNALEFINIKLDLTFSSQKEEAEQTLNNKYKEAIELKEKNFNLYQQINSMSNIIDIDDYFLNNYQKIIDIYPKVSNVVENMNDIVSNVNYGIDRMYLVDDLLCDENNLQNNIIQTKNGKTQKVVVK